MITRLLVPVLAGACVWGWQSTPQVSSQTKLDSTIEDYTLDGNSHIAALLKAARDFRLPMGIEWQKTKPNVSTAYTHRWQHTSVRSILEEITGSQPGYEFDVANGVVHIRLATLHSDQGNILDLRVPAFEVNNEYVGVASRRLQLLANRIILPPDPREAALGQGGSIGTGSGDRPVSLKMQNSTIRDILDQLCLAADLHIWIVSYPESQTRIMSGFVRTTTLGRDLSVEDKSQPIWTFLKWGRLTDQ
jgi:hypothetical protein